MAEKQAPRKLSMAITKGSLDMAYAAMIIANAARMSGVEVHLFFAFWGLDIINKHKIKNLHVATVGNPNMHPMIHFPTWLGAIPGMSAIASWMLRKEIDKLGFPPTEEYVQTLLDSGAHLYGCKMSMDMMQVKQEDLIEGAGVLGAMEFIEISEGGQILFVQDPVFHRAGEGSASPVFYFPGREPFRTPVSLTRMGV